MSNPPESNTIGRLASLVTAPSEAEWIDGGDRVIAEQQSAVSRELGLIDVLRDIVELTRVGSQNLSWRIRLNQLVTRPGGECSFTGLGGVHAIFMGREIAFMIVVGQCRRDPPEADFHFVRLSLREQGTTPILISSFACNSKDALIEAIGRFMAQTNEELEEGMEAYPQARRKLIINRTLKIFANFASEQSREE